MPTIKQIRQWGSEIGLVTERIGRRFARREQQEHAGRYLQGRIERNNGWQLAEQRGEITPVNLQHFIAAPSGTLRLFATICRVT